MHLMRFIAGERRRLFGVSQIHVGHSVGTLHALPPVGQWGFKPPGGGGHRGGKSSRQGLFARDGEPSYESLQEHPGALNDC